VCASYVQILKGSVQQDLTGVETRLKPSVLIDCIVAKFSFWILKEHLYERSTKLVSASKQQLNSAGWVHIILQTTASVQWSYKSSFCRLMILRHNTCTSPPHIHQPAQISWQLNSITVHTVQVCTIRSYNGPGIISPSAGAGRIFNVTDLSS
jgi:hypothetical protein